MIDTKVLLNTLLHLMPVLYGIAFFNYILVFFTEERLMRRLARPLLFTAVVFNMLYLLIYTVYFEHVPLVTVFQMLGAVGFALSVTYLYVESKTKTPYTGPFVLFLVVVFSVVQSEFPRFSPEVPRLLQSKIFSFHVTTAVLGYSAFATAAVYGLLYLLLYRQMRGKKFGLVFRRLPPLDVLDRMNFYSLIVGVTFFTCAVGLGLLWSFQILSTWSLDAKSITAILTLALYACMLLGRHFSSWNGARLAYSSLFGFLAVLFSIFGVNFFFTKFHGFVG